MPAVSISTHAGNACRLELPVTLLGKPRVDHSTPGSCVSIPLAPISIHREHPPSQRHPSGMPRQAILPDRTPARPSPSPPDSPTACPAPWLWSRRDWLEIVAPDS